MQDAKEEVRARLNIEDVIGEYVQLKRAGRNFKGLSPFTSERTPSFVVSPDKQIWHDFSSSKGGDVFSFVMLVEGIEFRQALEQLARRAGVDLSMYQSGHSGEIAKKKKRLLEATRLACHYFQQNMLKNSSALEYIFKQRSLSKEVVSNFKIGYAPAAGDALVRVLEQRGFTKQELSAAGLTNRFGGDLFRGRMMVPLMDSAGQVIGFTARIIEDDPGAPKYLNTPQTLLYDKSRHVFGLSQAKEAIRTAGYSVVVEGNLDVVSSHQVGITQVVATAGTALTEYHLKALARLSPQVRLAFDGDKAGVAASERAISIAQQVGVELTIVSLPDDAKDPDELIQQDPALWQAAIDGAMPAVDWLLAHYGRREDLTTAAGKRAYSSSAMQLIRALPDQVEQDHYLQIMAEKTGASLEALRAKLQDVAVAVEAPRKKIAPQVVVPEEPAAVHEHDVLAALLLEPSMRMQLDAETCELFATKERKTVANYLATHDVVVQEVPKELQSLEMYVNILLVRAEDRYASWTAKERQREIARLLRKMITEHKQTKRDQLNAELRDAEERHDDAEVQRLLGEISTLIKEIKHG